MQRREFLQTAAAVAGAAAGDVDEAEIVDQQSRLVELAGRDDSERWAYETSENRAHIRSGLLNAELDAICEEPSGKVETYSVGPAGIPLGFEAATEDNAESVGTLATLSAEQAEALAVDLLEQAHAARETGENTR